MNPEIKAKWIEALRSGKYNQTTSVLRDTSGMCCLGVLADIVAPEDWHKLDGNWSHRGEEQIPSASLCELVGLPLPARHEDEIGEDAVVNRLAEKNDQGYSFADIANIIEKEL